MRILCNRRSEVLPEHRAPWIVPAVKETSFIRAILWETDMSATFNETAKALSENAELRIAVMSVESAEERAAILREAGVPVPTHADLNAAHANMAGVDGAGITTPVAIGGGVEVGIAAAGAVA